MTMRYHTKRKTECRYFVLIAVCSVLFSIYYATTTATRIRKNLLIRHQYQPQNEKYPPMTMKPVLQNLDWNRPLTLPGESDLDNIESFPPQNSSNEMQYLSARIVEETKMLNSPKQNFNRPPFLRRGSLNISEIEATCPPQPKPSQNSKEHRYIRLWGKYGLLNNRIRCLANVISFSRRIDARVVLSETWEQFAMSALDIDWLKEMEPSIIITPKRWPHSDMHDNETLNLSCMDAFWCGGICDRDKPAVAILEKHWKVMDWKQLRAGGQAKKSRSKHLYETTKEPAMCGYAALMPKEDVRVRATEWAVNKGWFGTRDEANFIVGHHQRLQTTVLAEPVSMMCFSAAKIIMQNLDKDNSNVLQYYKSVCGGTLTPNTLLLASGDISPSKKPQIFLASDRFLANISNLWQASPVVEMYKQAEAVDPFHTTLGKALYASRFDGGAKARRSALESQSALVYIDMILLASADEFWPTPGSTMSNTICFWRKVWGTKIGASGLQSCEDIVYGWR
jgi:hypothetical protein